MERTIEFLSSEALPPLPNWALIALGAVLVALLGTLTILLRRRAFWRQLARFSDRTPDASGAEEQHRTPRSLLLRSRAVERFARRANSDIVRILGMDSLWLARLTEKGRRRDFQRILRFAPERGLFQCFLLGLEKPRFGALLRRWLEDREDFLPLRMLALSGRGEEFSGRAACSYFASRLDEIREMAGDPEWACRYFSLKILLYDRDERSLRAIWEAFEDPHPLIRRSAAREFRAGAADLSADSRKKLYAQVLTLLLKDPVFEVRRTAWERIHSEFSDLYALDTGSLSDDEAFHVLELLRTHSKQDENFALQYLESDHLDLRYSAALFLEKCGALDRLCFEVDMGDRDGLERNLTLLEKAAAVNVTSFLASFERTSNPATLLACVKILSRVGHRTMITEAARRVLRLFDGGPEYRELYVALLACVRDRGNDEALRLLDKELHRRREQSGLFELILKHLPARGDHIFTPSLLGFFKDPHVRARKVLREALARMPVSLVLPDIFEIIKAERGVYPHEIRMEALRLLTELKIPYCLQTILENLPILPLEEARAAAKILSEYPRSLFIEKANVLLEAADSKIRATLIACLPSTEEKEFLKPIRRSLKDADPDVRIASLWALVEFGDTRSVNQSVSMLRDPIERVRLEAGKALGTSGSSGVLAALAQVLDDENEVRSVKEAVIHGLGISDSPAAIDVLTDRLEQRDDLIRETQGALRRKTEKAQVTRLIEAFKDGGPKLRGRLTEVFESMGEAGEGALVELLRDDIPSLHGPVTEILQHTGFVESMVRRLSHRHSSVRREAAEILSLLGTESAFRGMVLAARDPDEEVRVKVIRTLERLETEQGKAVLEKLQNDPDRRVRKYTLWAMERLRAKTL